MLAVHESLKPTLFYYKVVTLLVESIYRAEVETAISILEQIQLKYPQMSGNNQELDQKR